MNFKRCMSFAVSVLFFLTAGCVEVPVKLKAVKSSGVEHIPVKLGMFPLLSEPVSGGGGINNFAAALTVAKAGDRASIIPPAYSKLSITQDSQIMTDQVSTDLASLGFLLKQVPVEVEEVNEKTPSLGKQFMLSLGTLEDLTKNYGIQAIVLGSVFFSYEHSSSGNELEKRVVAAHIAVVDIKTLDVLAQVTLPNRIPGFSVEETSSAITAALYDMTDQPKPDQVKK